MKWYFIMILICIFLVTNDVKHLGHLRVCVCASVCVHCSVMSNSLRSHWLYVAHQAPLSMGLSQQEYWSGLPFPSTGDHLYTFVELSIQILCPLLIGLSFYYWVVRVLHIYIYIYIYKYIYKVHYQICDLQILFPTLWVFVLFFWWCLFPLISFCSCCPATWKKFLIVLVCYISLLIHC